MGELIRIAGTDEISPGNGIVVEAKDKCLAVFNVDGSFHVTDNMCLHRGGPLGEGDLEGETVTCPWHGWEYNVKTGHCINNPSSNIKAYEAVVEEGDIKIEL